MDEPTKLVVIYGVVPAILGFGGYVVKSLLARIAELEAHIESKIDEQAARQLIADKVDPIKESMLKIEGKVDKIYDILIKKD